MSDRTNVTVIVYACPEDQRAAALAAIEQTVGLEYGGSDTLALGDAYYGHEVYGDFSEEVAAALIEAAPGATFATWTDPAYDWLGALVAYTPELGEYRHDCNASGDAMFSAAEVVHLAATHGYLTIAFARAIGRPWDAAIEAAAGAGIAATVQNGSR